MISPPPATAQPSDAERRAVVVATMAQATRLLRFAARHSPTLQDAEDAYQRSMVIALTKAPTVEPAQFMAWLHTVLRNEARHIARERRREAPAPEADVADSVAETEQAPVAFEAVAQWRERYRALHDALDSLTNSQRICLILQSAGESYDRIGAITGYSLRKVERSVLEGRRALRHWQVELIEGAVCERVGELIVRTVAGQADRRERRRVSKHVAHCGSCRARLRGEREMRAGLAALAPAPLLVMLPGQVPDPTPVLAWWERLTQAATVHTGNVAQAVTDLSGSGAARIGAGTAAIALAGIAGVPLVFEAAEVIDARTKARPAAVRPALTVPPPLPAAVTTAAAPLVVPAPARVTATPARRAPAKRATPRPKPAPADQARATPAAPAAPSPTPAARAVRPAPPPADLALEFGP